ncbi:MAG: TonB-dependent receptor [Candidatus Eremiobacteraeota bacterium]|nr:TonB-dependent receptor [Candidatus Eremiobacteraeota bacterium]
MTDAFCAFLVVLVTCAAPAFAASTGQIAGTVVDAKTKAPLAGAKINAVSPSGAFQTTSDAKGQFAIAGVVLDTYTISVQAPGYDAYLLQGATVTADETYRVTAELARGLRTIGIARARGITGAFQPTQTVDRYTVNSAGIDQLLGKSFSTDGTKLLSELPSVTVDRSGTPLIRGGFSFETSTQVEGIDYTIPTQSVTNRFSNVGNLNVLNGVGSLELIPGGGDASHGDTGTGLIAYTIKRGTNPPFTSFDYELGLVGNVHQFSFEDGRTFGQNGHISNYFSILSEDQSFQYGPYGIDPRSIGASAITPDPNANSNLNAHFGSLYTSAFFNTAGENTRDVLDNLIYKFGKNTSQSLQFFIQRQDVVEPQNYGGYESLTYPTVGQNGSYLNLISCTPPQTPSPGSLCPGKAAAIGALASQVYQQYPGGTPGGLLYGPDNAYNPFEAFKIEYNNSIDAKTALGLRYYRTFSNQLQFQASQGLFDPQNGGTRTGIGTDLTKILSDKHTLQFGGRYEFAAPYGTAQDYIDYLPAFGDVPPGTSPLIATNLPTSPIPDFITPSALATGCRGTPFAPTSGNPAGTFLCGYLAHYFPAGKIPTIPPETEVPTAKQQSYSTYLQDTYSPNRKLKVLLGLRLDGYNFLVPDDPTNPPAIDGIRHQRLYEPHAGVSLQMGAHDAVRANFGRTLEIPLPTFIGTAIDRSVYNPFNNVPSYDNSKGPFDPLRPSATQATYCGPGTPQTLNGVLTVLGNQPCANYADQLYWLQRNYRFGLQGQSAYPLRGSTFTNYDFSYSHEFKDGTAFKMTPFYRRGYDVVEQTRTLLGFDPESEVANLSPVLYSNLGQQSAAGLEFDVTHFRDYGLSYQFTTTYINQIGNDPPGTYLPTASLQLGELYHSPELSPLQETLALTYRSRGGLRINPVISYKYGYPYGAGIYYALDYNGVPVYVPFTDALVGGAQGAIIANAIVNPQNPGTISNPNIAVTRGTEALNSGPGTLRSKGTFNTDLTIELARPHTTLVYGIGITNLFDQTADVPTVNVSRVAVPVSTGNYYFGAPTAKLPAFTVPTGTANSSYLPYIVFPNQPPIAVRVYVQAKL